MKYVIIGGDAAGMSAAMQILKYDHTAAITTLEKTGIYSYAQCGLPYAISGIVSDSEELMMRSRHVFQNKYGIDARVFHHVKSIDTLKKQVSGLHTNSTQAFTLDYDKLLIATGADPFVPNWPGVGLKGVHTLKTIPDANVIMEQLENNVNDITIVGGGYIGLEMAESFRLLDKHVRIINRSEQLGGFLDPELSSYILNEAKKNDIVVHLNENIMSIAGEDRVTAIHTNKGKYKTHLVLVATGIRPNTNLLKNTAVQTAGNGAIIVNEFMETNVKDIYAAGDCATQYHLVKEKDDYIPLGTNANKQGRIAGMNMAGEIRAFKGIVGTSILRFMNLSIGRTGLSAKDVEKLDVPYASVTVEGKHIASYYPNAEEIIVKLTYRPDNLLLLGGQVIGKKGIDKRIDVLATALFNQMTIMELEDLDLSYAPPYNGTWDPIQRAARKAMRNVET